MGASTTVLPAAASYVMDGVTPEDIEYVVENVRLQDLFEMAAFGLAPQQAAHHVTSAAHDVYTAFYKERPAFIFGTVQMLPGVRQLFGFGTDDTKRTMRSVNYFTNHYWLPLLRELGTRRIQVHVPVESRESVNWLMSFGMTIECEMRDYAVNGARMLQLAFTEREFEKYVHVSEEFVGLGSASSGDTSPGPDEDECRHPEGS